MDKIFFVLEHKITKLLKKTYDNFDYRGALLPTMQCGIVGLNFVNMIFCMLTYSTFFIEIQLSFKYVYVLFSLFPAHSRKLKLQGFS